MKSEETVIRMLGIIEQLPPSYTAHALQAILKLILDYDPGDDIAFLEDFYSDVKDSKEVGVIE